MNKVEKIIFYWLTSDRQLYRGAIEHINNNDIEELKRYIITREYEVSSIYRDLVEYGLEKANFDVIFENLKEYGLLE